MSETIQPPAPARTWLRITGLCLWLLLFAAIYFVWQARQTGSESVELPGDDSARTAREEPQPIVIDPDKPPSDETPRELEDFELVERSGRKVTKADLLGRPWVACFVFTRCAGPCPQIMGQFSILQRELKDTNVRLVTITVDPANDTPEVLSRYADAFNADADRWWFLTGSRDAIYRLITYGFELPVGEQAGLPYHTNRVVHVDSQGRIVKTYLFPKETERIALRRALSGEKDVPNGDSHRPVVAPKPEVG